MGQKGKNPAVAFNEQWDVTDVAINGDTAYIDLWYPSCDGRQKYLDVGLVDVRSADGLRISYDFDRDGWKIEQASVFEFECDDKVQDAHWQEVAFIKAWARRASQRSRND
jgi:hypothetical protein